MKNLNDFPQRTWSTPQGYCEIIMLAVPGAIVTIPFGLRRVTLGGKTIVIENAPFFSGRVGLSMNTIYYVYLYYVSGSTAEIEVSTTPTSNSFSKAGDPTRTLIGVVQTSADAIGWRHQRSKIPFGELQEYKRFLKENTVTGGDVTYSSGSTSMINRVMDIEALLLPSESVRLRSYVILQNAAASISTEMCLTRATATLKDVPISYSGGTTGTVTSIGHGLVAGNGFWLRHSSSQLNADDTFNVVSSATTNTFTFTRTSIDTPDNLGTCSITKTQEVLADSTTGAFGGAVGSGGSLTQTIPLEGTYTNSSIEEAKLEYFGTNVWNSGNYYGLSTTVYGGTDVNSRRSCMVVEFLGRSLPSYY